MARPTSPSPSTPRRAGAWRRRAPLTPRARTIAGWLAAVLLVVGVAFIVGRLGGEVGGPAASGTSPTPLASPLPITFGTRLLIDGAVDLRSTTNQFSAADVFAYSIDTAPPPSRAVYVEVERTGATPETVQAPARQDVPTSRRVVGFEVPAQALLDDFEPGAYVMRIYVSPGSPPLGNGEFELLAAPEAPAS